MERRRHVVKGWVTRRWFREDGVHLSRAGYGKLVKKLGHIFQ